MDGSARPDAAALAALAAQQAERITQLDTVIEAAPIGIGLVTLDGLTPVTNDTLRRMLGYTPEEFASRPFTEFTAPEDVAENERLFRRMVEGGGDFFAMEKRFIRKDGSLLWAELTVSLVRDADGHPDYAIGMAQDITERKRLADELRAAELHYRLIVEHVPAVVYIAEPGAGGRFRYVSPRLEWMLGYTPQQWLADPGMWLRAIHPEDAATMRRHEELVDQAVEGEMFPSTTYRLRHRDGYDVWVRDDAVLRRDRDGRPLLHGVLLDVTQEKALEERLAYMVDHDALTGLVNRAHFHRLVDLALSACRFDGGRSVAVLYVDLDDFKGVNDGFGHAVGDRVLVAVADRLRALVPAGTAVARLGGDEFALLLTGPPDAGAAAAGVAAALGEVTVDVAGETARVRASVGVAVANRWHTTELLLHDADQAMYQCKVGHQGDAPAHDRSGPGPQPGRGPVPRPGKGPEDGAELAPGNRPENRPEDGPEPGHGPGHEGWEQPAQG